MHVKFMESILLKMFIVVCLCVGICIMVCMWKSEDNTGISSSIFIWMGLGAGLASSSFYFTCLAILLPQFSPLLRYKVLPSLFVGWQDDFSRWINSQMIDKGLVHVTPRYLKSHSDTRVRLHCPNQANEHSESLSFWLLGGHLNWSFSGCIALLIRRKQRTYLRVTFHISACLWNAFLFIIWKSLYFIHTSF